MERFPNNPPVLDERDLRSMIKGVLRIVIFLLTLTLAFLVTMMIREELNCQMIAYAFFVHSSVSAAGIILFLSFYGYWKDFKIFCKKIVTAIKLVRSAEPTPETV